MEGPKLTLRLLQPLRNPPVTLLWGGLSAAALGDQLFGVVLSWVAVGLLGTAAGYLAAAQSVGMLATAVLAGAWADRIEHRRLMVLADLLRAAALLGIAAAWWMTGGPVVWTLFAGVFLVAAGMGLYRPAMQTVVPALVADIRELPATNALIDTTERIARLLGPALVGVTSGWVPLVMFVLLNAAGFVISAVTTLGIIRRLPAPASAARRVGVWDAILRGFAAVRRHRLLWFVLGISGPLNGAWFTVFFVGLPLIVERGGVTAPGWSGGGGGGGGGGLAAYGLIMTGYGGANLLTTLAVGSRGLPRRPGRMVFVGNVLLAAGIVLMGIAPLLVAPGHLFWWLFAAACLAAPGGPMHDVTVATLRQIVLPRTDMAAAIRAFMVVNHVGALAAMLVAPSLFDTIGVAPTVLLCGIVILAVAATGLWRHGREAMAG